jgi:hypothetical protein
MYKTDQALLSDSLWNSLLFATYRTLDIILANLFDGILMDRYVVFLIYANFNETNGEDVPVQLELTPPTTVLSINKYSVLYVTKTDPGNGWTTAAVFCELDLHWVRLHH